MAIHGSGNFAQPLSFIDCEVIKIGLNKFISKPDPKPFEEQYGIRDFVLCVGRIEDLKNQIGLISAMKGENIPLVLIGSLNPAHQSYCRKVLREVKKRDNLYYLGPMERPMLMSAFAAAKVHVLPSWFETTGLTNLEAGRAGCNVVSTNRGYARDYLHDYAWYCDPSDPLSIRNAVQAAYDSPPKSGIKEYIRKELDIQKMLEHFIDLYTKVLSRNG